jgi:hypothetical protein
LGKNTLGGMSKWNTIFNIIIENNILMDINLSNRKYTLCNDPVIPTYAKLEKFLVSVSWMDKYPIIQCDGYAERNVRSCSFNFGCWGK